MVIATIVLLFSWTHAGLTCPAIIRSEFIVPDPSFSSSHASTIAETPGGLVAAWFGGSREGAEDVGIWLSSHGSRGWCSPREIATGSTDGGSRRFPCWNPVLFRRAAGELLLFFKIGPSPSTWWGMLMVSADGGRTWSRPYRLPQGIVGPAKNKPLELEDNTLLCGSSSEDAGWRVHMEWSRDPLGDWRRGPDLNSASAMSAIQPALLRHRDGRYQILCRSKQGTILESWSAAHDATSWSRLKPTVLPNPDSGIDAVTLADGRFLLVHNPTRQGRGILRVSLSKDGKNWRTACCLENEPDKEFSYPAVIQTKDGLVHVTYTWKRERIKHVVLDPSRF